MKAIRFRSAFAKQVGGRRAPSRARARARVAVEALEGRRLLATFSVTNLHDSGAGSFRQAIIDANARPGADAIDFGVAGVIRVGRASLPAITDTTSIDGTTAPGFSGAPAVTIDFRGTHGLYFAEGADGSSVLSLSLVGAGGSGVTLNASRVTVQGNYIGLRADGSTVAGNRGDGVRINASSHGNLIGNENPVSSINFDKADAVSIQPVSGWQGVRGTSAPGQYLITGTSNSNGLLYVGPISGAGGKSYSVNYPGAASTSVYGPDDLGNGAVRLVGSYRTGADSVNGFVYEGTAADLANHANFRTIAYPGAQFNYVHSTMGGLAVGNADGPEGNLPIGTGHAFLYDVAHDAFLADVVYPGSTSTTAYGIWYNGKTSYTIVGGYSTTSTGTDVGHGYMVDYDSAAGQYSNWASFDYPNGVVGKDHVTHFEGISSVEKGVYILAADSVQSGTASPVQGSFVTVRRNPDFSFGPSAWFDLNYPGVNGWTSANSVAGDKAVGIVFTDSGTFSYQATVNSGFQLSNVIAGNSGNGVGIYGSHGNRVAMNNIGTNAAGTLARPNGQNGVLLTQGAAENLIGGQATNGNNPTSAVFVRPPQGNLISGNRGAGVLINRGATRNVLSGNFIGTTASGNASLGNHRDGVTIDGANGNQLIGCTFQQDPFVFYNVISGNRGNGLRINNSNDTTVHANFLGVGANNASVVANGGDGLLVSGRSSNTQVGGVIPLGNVISGNNRNGIEVRDQASGFVSFNTFAGVFAFGAAAPNRRDGILITSTGGNNVIRTTIVSGNLGDGIEIGGNATGVQVTETAIGTNTDIQYGVPNGGSGVKISGRAHGNVIGGFQASIVPQTTLSSNRRYGIEIVGSAHDNLIFHTFIGTNFDGKAALGNDLGGILLGPGTSRTTIGGTSPDDLVKILHSGGDGLTIASSRGNVVQGVEIMANQGWGLFARGDCAGTVVRDSLIMGNARGDVDLSRSKGVVYIP